MKKMGKRFGILLAAAWFLACFINLPVEAADNKEATDGGYTYTVRFFAGQHGVFTENGQDVLVFEGKTPVDSVEFTQDMVKLNDGSKYYVKGIRESGKDNNTVKTNSTGSVDHDMDYVVAYGLRANMVAYYVRYVDVNGNELAETSVYYGNVGDKPVVAYLYIDGYLPQTYNLTKTLDAVETENVFTFIYTPLTGAQIGETVTTNFVPGTVQEVVEVIPGEGGQNTVTTVVDGDGGLAGGAAADGQAADGGVTIAEPAVPLDTIDLDTMTDDGVYIEEPAVPLADMNLQLGPIEVDARRLLVTLVILTATAMIALSSFWYWRPYRKKEKNDEKDVARPM